MKIIRQGDVALIPTHKKPSAKAVKLTHCVLALGEQTGHAHQVVALAPAVTDNPDPIAPCELFEEPDGTRILVLHQPSALRHEEHGPAVLEPGQSFIVRRQVEWSLDDVRQVAD